jgi:aspartyl-tRNA(Asn)/glutamyl-tRNA(Gln) amidotransferase subunit B
LRTPEEARLFMQKLRQIYLAIGISDCSMEEGSLRCDGNVSLRRRGETKLGTKTELKNMNSFKNLHDGLAYEICRQAEVLEEGGIIYQETRHWDPSKKRTIVMRVKETADDYRLFPEPDMAPFDISDEFIENVRKRLPELPDQKAKRFESEYGLSAYDARHLVEDRTTASFFEECMGLSGAEGVAKPLANIVINDVAAYLNSNPTIQSLDETAFTPQRALDLVTLIAQDKISSKQGKEVFAAILEEDKDPAAIVAERGMEQVSDTGAIEAVVDGILAAFPDKVEQYKGGKTGLLGFFVGQCMKEMKGQGNPKVINELLAKKLN